MKTQSVQLFRAATLTALAAPLTLAAANNRILGWNNLGMHCLDSESAATYQTGADPDGVV